MKNVHPEYGAGIRTHNLQNMSLLLLPLDEGSYQQQFFVFYQQSDQMRNVPGVKRVEQFIFPNVGSFISLGGFETSPTTSSLTTYYRNGKDIL